MMRKLRYHAAILMAAIIPAVCGAQVKTDGKSVVIEGVVEFDRTVWDFGEVKQDQGPLTCSFNVKNLSGDPIVIYNVVSSCGCTGVKWTREPIMAGGTGRITATYSNDEGPYPFDKNLTAYISGIKKPVILRLRGIVLAKKVSNAELYPLRKGPMGLRKTDIKLGNMSQGSQRGDWMSIANLGDSPMNVTFADVTPGMEIAVSPNPVPAGETARMTYVVTADRTKWGKNYYYASPVVNGRKYSPLGIWTFTKEDFSGWTRQQLADGALPEFSTSTYDFGEIRKGTPVKASFTVKNLGASPLVIYKADAESEAVKTAPVPSLPGGKEMTISMDVDTSSLSPGDQDIVVILTTNSPIRPIVNLSISGKII
ncbi:MAG: DUF1573 domain-containing protein [Candidatus Cryptobacteroides sp.]